MVDDPKSDTQAWMTLGDAAAALGTTYEAVRQRVKRRSLRSMKGNDGKLRVLIDTSRPKERHTQDPGVVPQADTQGDLVAELRARVVDKEAEIGRLQGALEAVQKAANARLADRDAEVARMREDHQREAERLLGLIRQLADQHPPEPPAAAVPWWRRWRRG